MSHLYFAEISKTGVDFFHSIVPVTAMMNSFPTQETQDAGETVGGGFIPTSLWDMISYAQGFEWPLGFLFLLGLFLLTSAYVRYFMQWRGSDDMLQLDPANITAKEFASALDQAKQDSPYRHSGHRLLEEYGRSGSAKSMIDYAMHYIESDHDRYRATDRHINAAVYIALSLGLLGTLLGIFVLFMSGDRHEASDLVGLGIAVVSTMLALVVRLILWPLNIFLQGFVRSKYSLLKEWTVAFAYALAEKRSVSYEDNS